MTADLSPGFYWVCVTEPLCDGGGILVEPWREPEIARFDGREWFLTGEEHSVPDQISVRCMGPRLVPMGDKPCDACGTAYGHESYCTPGLRERAARVIAEARARRP